MYETWTKNDAKFSAKLVEDGVLLMGNVIFQRYLMQLALNMAQLIRR